MRNLDHVVQSFLSLPPVPWTVRVKLDLTLIQNHLVTPWWSPPGPCSRRLVVEVILGPTPSVLVTEARGRANLATRVRAGEGPMVVGHVHQRPVVQPQMDQPHPAPISPRRPNMSLSHHLHPPTLPAQRGQGVALAGESSHTAAAGIRVPPAAHAASHVPPARVAFTTHPTVRF